MVTSADSRTGDGARGFVDAAAFLPRHDRGFFDTEVVHTVRAAGGWSVELAARLDAALTRYGSAVGLMLHQPATLVHGKFRDLLVLRNGPRFRICPVDWEPAAIGAPYFDLALLAEGLPEPQGELLFDAYRSRARLFDVPTGAPEVFHHSRLHRALGLVRKACKRSTQLEEVAAAVCRVEQLAAEL